MANSRPDEVAGDHLRLTEITKRFAGRTVVDRLSFVVKEGEIIVLFGPSGCGKTTCLRLIAGLETPDEGEIWISGRCVARSGINLVPPAARGIGFVFQDLALWPHLTVAGQLDFVLAATDLSRSDRLARRDEILRLVRIDRFARHYPAALSGGEQQRVAIARALVAYPRLLLLDEPFSNLDSDLKSDLLAELASLQRQLKVTTAYVTHNHEETATLAERVIWIREGRIERIDAWQAPSRKSVDKNTGPADH